MRQVESLLFQMRPRGQEYNNLLNETEAFWLNSLQNYKLVMLIPLSLGRKIVDRISFTKISDRTTQIIAVCLLKSKTFSVTLRLYSTKHLDYERSRTYTSKSK